MTHRTLTHDRTLKLCTSLCAVVACALYSSFAGAQTLGARSDFTLGVERVFGMYSARLEFDRDPGADAVITPNSFGIAYQRPIIPLSNPRVAFDYFVAPQLSIGGTLGFDSSDPGNDPDILDVEHSSVLFAPRVGYALDFNPEWGVWFRGGITYVGEEWGNDRDLSLIALTGEAMFYFMPAPFVGFTGGPVLDLGVTGEEETNTANNDYNARLFGITFGMFARF